MCTASASTASPRCRPNSSAKSPRWPYLKKGERVRYSVRPNAAGLDQAVQVVWLNGTPIPPERTNYLGGVHERAKRLLGEAVFDVMSKQSTDPEILQELRAQMEMAQTTIRNAENFVRKLGMDPADFPTVKAATGRGRYQFANQQAAEEQSGVEEEQEHQEEEEEHHLQEEQQPLEPAVAPESEEEKEHAATTEAAAIPTGPFK